MGQDYDETFLPVVRFESIRMLIAIAVQFGLKLRTSNGCYNSISKWKAQGRYIHETYAENEKDHLVCKLKKSI